MFDITADDIRLLGDADLRELTARLCEAEVAKLGLSTASVTWGGHQDAADAGIDIRVGLAATLQINGWIPRPATGFQVKKKSMPRMETLKEMRPNDVVRDVIADLAARSGAYIIVSSEDTTDKALRNRRAAMREAVQDLAGSEALVVDFYDRQRLATWTKDHPGVLLWVRQKIGRPLARWQPFGPWADVSEEVSGEYLLDEKLRIHLPTGKTPEGVSALTGLEQVRNTLRLPQGIVRLVGLSGVGKTRLVQALFQKEIGKDSLDPSIAAYVDIAEPPEPTPTDLASQLIATGKRAILIVDNCPPSIHASLSKICRASGSTVSVITIEYDIRDGEVPEGTEVFRLDTSSRELIKKLVLRRFPAISATDATTLADFSDGNARVAMCLAWTLRGNETIAGLNNDELLLRLIEQRHAPDPALMLAAEACSLVYSFEGEDVGCDSELARLGALVGQSANEVFRHVSALLDRGLAQRGGVWRAVLPQAIANRLATNALKKIPPATVEERLLRRAPERVLKSFTRRLGHLDSSPDAVQMAQRWLSANGTLGKILNLDQVRRAAFENIAPVLPSATLEAIERALGAIEDVEILRTRRDDALLLRKLAYEARLFSRSVALLGKIVATIRVGEQSNRISEAFTSLFHVSFSGTLASIEQRLAVVRELFSSVRDEDKALALKALDSALSTYLRPFGDFEFGSRSRDYGYWPRSPEETRHWFASVLALGKQVACSNSPIAPEVRHVVAKQLRGIWLLGCAYNDIAQTCVAISEHGFWPEGWFAIRQIQFHEGAVFTPEIASQLASIEARLRPRDLAERIRAVVLSEDHAGLYTTDNPDRSNNVTAGLDRISNLSRELGEAAIDDSAFGEVLPQLVRGKAGHLWNFGMGLARGSLNPKATWQRLLDALLATPESERQIQVLQGFMRESRESNTAVTEELLEDLLDDARVAWLLPPLQAASGVEQRGAERLVASLSLGTVPIGNYRSLASGGATETIPAPALAEIVLLIASKPKGFRVGVEILASRLHIDKSSKRELSPEIAAAGCDLIRETPFSTTESVDLDYDLGQIAEACLGGQAGQQTAQDVLQRLTREVDAQTARAFYFDDLIFALFLTNPTVALDALCGGQIPELHRGIGIIRDLRRNPVDAVPPQELFGWCDQNSTARYPAIAGVIAMFDNAKDDNLGHWCATAIELLERAPDRIAVLQQYVNRIEPVWHFELRAGSRTPAATALAALPTFADSELAAHVAKEVDRLQKTAEEQSLVRVNELLRGHNRFE